MSTLIIGASSDIAAAIAHQVCAKKQEIHVGLTARNMRRIRTLSNVLAARYHGISELFELDITDAKSRDSLFKSLHVIPETVYIAIGLLTDEARARSDPAYAQSALNTNYSAIVALLEELSRRMEDQGHGTIAVISSVAGVRGRASNGHYGASKAALNSYLSSLRQRCQPSGVHICTLLPGFVDTRMTKDLDLPAWLTSTPETVAKKIVRATEKKRAITYVPGYWRFIMGIIRIIPEWLFKQLSM